MDAMEAAALAVLGTLGGAIVGAWATLAVERSRREYEDRTRWHTDRRQLYARVFRAADSVHKAAQSYVVHQLAAMAGEPDATQGPDRPDLTDYLQISSELELLLPTRSRTALLLLDNAVLYLSLAAEITHPPKLSSGREVPAFGKADKDFSAASRRLFDRAQVDLGIPQPRARVWRRLWRRILPSRKPADPS